MSERYAIVDLFAGPGGLAEGFSSFIADDESRPFRVSLSVEKEKAAHATLLLRCFLRQFQDGFPPEYYDFLNLDQAEPDWAAIYPREWTTACKEAPQLTLGDDATRTQLEERIEAIRDAHGDSTIVIGGPPCQAYSLVGRARNRGIRDYTAEGDARHYLYREYIDILKRLRPAAFVMENVKGMLSSSVDGSPIFARILDDLRNAGGDGSYKLLALSPQRAEGSRLLLEPDPCDFVLRSEDFGVPQARHRVIILGMRSDLARRIDERHLSAVALAVQQRCVCVSDVLDGMPRLRSGLSRGQDSLIAWDDAAANAARDVLASDTRLPEAQTNALREIINAVLERKKPDELATGRSARRPNGIGEACPRELDEWLRDPKLHVVPNNETRGHMASDLARYLFAAAFAKATGRSPKAADFPDAIAPAHRNWTSGKFSDRFRVQIDDAPSTTVTSHISKDGHYFIHPDPHQCRSLTVREAARLQTFPDNYYFKGNRTEQFVQVGNAVPPYLARQIAERLHTLLVAASRKPDRTEMSARAEARSPTPGLFAEAAGQ